uniref:N-acetyllactosaminide beta-1,3-N-acetylglucosaminyltransferase n=3 Tax=Wuchereria bancrofti TaxID=6293 RepID=A0AAF5PR41_WUCBA
MQKAFGRFIFAILISFSTVIIISKLDDNTTVCNQYYENDISRFYVYKNYCVLPYVSHSDMESNMTIFERITLVLQISYNYLNNNILEQLESWDGPVTFMVIIPSVQVYKTIQNIKETLSRFPSHVLNRLSAHVLFRSKYGCKKDVIDKLNETNSGWRYPINVARNVARMFVRSKYVLISDSEFIFPEKFESRMCALAQNQLTRNPKTALVVRIFEVNDTIKQMPRNKAELRELFFKGLAVEFHVRYNMKEHTIPHLDQWFNKQENKQEVNINSILKFSRRGWEPQFVSLNTIPLHDENFPFSLRDNTVLRWEMCRQNYTFALVNDLFMVHRGIKTIKDLPLTKKRQKHSQAQFNIAIKLFKQRMDHQYPETKKLCPEFGA